jgi:hypothetical protein
MIRGITGQDRSAEINVQPPLPRWATISLGGGPETEFGRMHGPVSGSISSDFPFHYVFLSLQLKLLCSASWIR